MLGAGLKKCTPTRRRGSTLTPLGARSSFGITLALLLITSYASADGLIATPLAKGEPAPFTGQLLSPELALTLGIKADQCDIRLDLATKRVQRLADIDLTLCKRLQKIASESASERRAALLRRIERAESVWRSPAIVATISVALTLAAVVVARYVVVEQPWRS